MKDASISYWCDKGGTLVGIERTPEHALLVGNISGSPSESFTLYTSWLGLAGVQPTQRSAAERSAAERSAAERSAAKGGLYYMEGFLKGETQRFVIETVGYADCPIASIADKPHRCSESFFLLTSWLGFDGLEGEKEVTSPQEQQASASYNDPYSLYCVG
jgi:hypothetical protein